MDNPKKLRAYQRAARSVSLVTVFQGTGVLLALLQNACYAFFFGAGKGMDIFFASYILFNVTNKLLQGGMLSTVFVPIFTGLWVEKDYRKAWEIRISSGLRA